MPACPLSGSVSPRPRLTRRRRTRRGWSRRLAPALAACVLSVDAAGPPDLDLRPIYYAMLAAVESSFTAHTERVEDAYRASREALERSAERDLRLLEAEGEEIERARREGEAVLEAEREALNARIDALNEAVRGLESDSLGADSTLARSREAYERVLAALRTARARYRELSARLQTPREALADAARSYREGTSDDAREIARLDRAYRRFAVQVVEAHQERETELRLDLEAFDSWQRERIEGLKRDEGELTPLAERYLVLQSEHEHARQELNRRVATYNEGLRAAGDDAAQSEGLAALRAEIDEYRRLVGTHRERALVLVREIGERRAGLKAAYAAFDGERRDRKQALRRHREAITSEGSEIAALVEARRADLQAQIEAVEDRVRRRLATLRDEVDREERGLEEEFGPAPKALLEAVAEWTRTLDPSHLYGPDGTPRFDPSPPRSAALYDAVGAARGREDGVRGALAARLAEVQRERAAVAGEREHLVERQRAFASGLAERSSHWKARLDAAGEEARRLETALAAYSEGSLGLAGLEFEALQGALLHVLGTPAATRSEPGERERLRASIAGRGATFGEVLVALPAPAPSPLEDFVAAGRARDPAAPELEWPPPSTEIFPRERAPEERILEGEDARRLLAAWYQRLGALGALAPLARRLSFDFPSHSAAELGDALYGLFESGMLAAGGIFRYRWPDGVTAYQIRILERSYWLEPDGRLLLTPLAW